MGKVAGQLEESVFEGGCFGPGFETSRGIEREELAFIEDGNAVGEKFNFRERVRSEEQSDVASLEELGLEEAAEFGGGNGVQAARRLIQKEHGGLMEKGASEAQALDCSCGECADLAIESRAEAELSG